MWKIIWIDLWTTNSCFAYMLGDKSEVIANAEWDRTTPSVVYIKWDQLLVWKLAKRKAILEPKNVIYEVKRFIGRKFSEVQDEIKRLPYEVVEGSSGEVLVKVDWKTYRPEEISAYILKKIKADAEKFLWETVDKAVITVPAYFNDSQRNATKAAWEIAGLKVERIINEPTAAALAYGQNKTKDEKIAVYDFWGWTFDITLLEIGSEGTFQVLSTNWDTHLWGADIDKILIDYLLQTFKNQNNWMDLSNNAMALQRLKEEAENAKIQLSQAESVDINIPFITTWEDGQPKHIQDTITRAQFDRMINSLVEKSVQPCKNALKDAWLQPSEIDEIILVGWSTRVPLVKQKVQEVFWTSPKATVNPDEAVAIWAAVQGWILQWDVTDILLLDVTPLSLWVEVEWGLVDVVIARNTTIPVKKSKIYTTAVDNQPAVTVHVVQWERPIAKDNKSLWMFNLEGIPSMMRWQPQIEVTFEIDASGIMHVVAKEKSTWKEQKVTISWATNLSDKDIEQAQKDAEKFAEEDKKRKEIIEAKNRVEMTTYQLEKFETENKDKLSEDEKWAINDMIKEWQDFKSKEDISSEEADKLIEKFNAKLTELYQKYPAQQSQTWETTETSSPTDAGEPEIINPDEAK